jgi:hypothetical protein
VDILDRPAEYLVIVDILAKGLVDTAALAQVVIRVIVVLVAVVTVGILAAAQAVTRVIVDWE